MVNRRLLCLVAATIFLPALVAVPTAASGPSRPDQVQTQAESRGLASGQITTAQATSAQIASNLAQAARPHLCGSRFIARERARGAAVRLPTRPDQSGAAARPARGAQDPIVVGTQLEFPVFGRAQLVSATCRFVGAQVFVFVENRHWDTEGGSIFQSHVDGLATLFEQSTPADSTRGIYDLTTAAFGAPPDVDGYEPVFLLVLEAPFEGLIGWFDRDVAGHPTPEYRRDVIHLNESAVRGRSYLARGTLAHEFQHLIHWNWDEDEEPWIDEGLAGYAEELVGYPEADSAAVPDYLQRPDTPLIDFPDYAENRYYGATYLYASYLAQRYGPELIHRLVGQPRNGIFGIEAALAEMGVEDDFEATWVDWVLANVTGGELGFSYDALAGRRTLTYPLDTLPQTGRNGQASRWATQTVLFRTPGNVAVDFDGDDAGRYRVWSVGVRATGSEVVELELDTANQGRSLHADVDSVIFIVGRTSLGGGNYELDARRFVPTAIEQVGAIPDAFELLSAYPNPFNSSIQIQFELQDRTDVEVTVVDILGQQVWQHHLSELPAGAHVLRWDGIDDVGRAVASGAYRVRLRSAADQRTMPILLLR
ncbi:MAG: T9SS type A sorting domain-containing protein [Gemmatimonadetes bacterium]|jgi:hypothetical protein|nr:T9SS type A sorting domain-containing protein [Gemmatimonadota bacterium]MBT6145359.1 T9SS type A sorting domain-containing protein [Gemmatimonadota bacterium]MBT7861495.1 T9SS type A sorting domain-containing protein [Gemmatimonadota bacterium]